MWSGQVLDRFCEIHSESGESHVVLSLTFSCFYLGNFMLLVVGSVSLGFSLKFFFLRFK